MKLLVIPLVILSSLFVCANFQKCSLIPPTEEEDTTPEPEPVTIPPSACALWTRFNFDNEPITLGFSAGTTYDNSTAYVGRGIIKGRIIPARISVNRGAFVPWSYEQYINDAEYLVVPPNCDCSWMSPETAFTHRGIVQTPDEINFFAIGRVTFENGRVAISRVKTAPCDEMWEQSYIDFNGNEVNDNATEVLVCETTITTEGKPKINFQSESCSVWTTVNYNNNVTTHGLKAGTSINNTVAWIGRGSYGGQFQTGRFQAETGNTFVPSDAENPAAASEYLIVPEGCGCVWMEPAKAINATGLIRAPDELFHYSVGRYNTSDGRVAISKVTMVSGSNFTEWYSPNMTTMASRSPALEVLVCQRSFSKSSNLRDFPILDVDKWPPATIVPPIYYPCDLWANYDFDASPQVNGLSAGTSAYYFHHSNGVTIPTWIARGILYASVEPGRVEISPSSTNGEIYITRAADGLSNTNNEVLANVNFLNDWSNLGAGEYFVKRQSCNCFYQSVTFAVDNLGLVRISERSGINSPEFAIARIREVVPGPSKWSIGKTRLPTHTTYYTNPSSGAGTSITNTNTQVLVCRSTADMSQPPVITYPTFNEACALWSRYTLPIKKTWPSTHGVYLGRDRYDRDVYVGRGLDEFDSYVQKAGHLIFNRPGVDDGIYTYNTGVTYKLQEPEYLVKPAGCYCSFLPYLVAINEQGLVHTFSAVRNYAIARMIIPDFTPTRYEIFEVNTANPPAGYTSLKLLVCKQN